MTGPAAPASPRFTVGIAARCPVTGALGTALASSTLAIGSRCPHVAAGQAAVITQGVTNTRLGPLALDLLRVGLAPDEVLEALVQHDRRIETRQIAIVTADGDALAHTGAGTIAHAADVAGDGFVCLGNGLSDPAAVAAMAAAFHGAAASGLDRRLLGALEAARPGGGALSAALIVATPGQQTRVDLRIDAAQDRDDAGGSGDAVGDLRRLFERYRPLVRYYEEWPDNPELGDWRSWDAEASDRNPGEESNR